MPKMEFFALYASYASEANSKVIKDIVYNIDYMHFSISLTYFETEQGEGIIINLFMG